jgi:RNA polymerase sigma factor (sigma-70 family)
MRALRTDEAELVRAAQSGDRQSLDELVATYLPLVYNVVGRALSGEPDIDDIVQDTMMRALRDLRTLHTPESFRAWLVAIAIRQVSTHQLRQRRSASRTAPLDEASEVVDTESDFEGLTILRLRLSGQRRQTVQASRWLDPDDRMLLSLWWMEAAEQLTRKELAEALGVTTAHAGVRVQRMLDQLEVSRVIIAALAVRPRCAELSSVVANWNGQPGPLWRKRIGRHVRSCAVCSRAGEGMVPTSRLLLGLALVPVPIALSASLVGKSIASVAAVVTSAGVSAGAATVVGTGATGASAGIKTGLFDHLARVVGAHPAATVVVTAATAMLAGGAIVSAAAPPTPPTPRPPAAALPSVLVQVTSPATTPSASPKPKPSLKPTPKQKPTPSPTPGFLPVALGRASLELADSAGRYVAYPTDLGGLTQLDAGSSFTARQQATFEVVAGLADAHCFSLRFHDGRYVRHASWRLRLSADEGTVLFREDATFCARAGATADSVSLESYDYPGRFVRRVGDALWVDTSDGTAEFRAASSFRIGRALAG